MADLKILTDKLGGPDIYAEWGEHGPKYLWSNEWMNWFRATETKTVRTYEDSEKYTNTDEHPVHICGEIKEDGSPCTYIGTTIMLGTHKRVKHKIVPDYCQLIATNACPNCNILFKTKVGLREHINKYFNKDGICPDRKFSGTSKAWPEKEKKLYWNKCKICALEYEDIRTANFHNFQHMREMLEIRRTKIHNDLTLPPPPPPPPPPPSSRTTTTTIKFQ